MSNGGGQQQSRPTRPENEDKKGGGDSMKELPLESSPYVKYSDLEEYKMQAYGTQGHLDPVEHTQGVGTDAPTISGGGPSKDKVPTAETANLRGQQS